MSKIALSAPVAGVGTATIKGPETAADIEFQLPPRAGQVLVAGPAFSAVQSAGQAITATTFTKLNFATEEYDTANCYDPATSRFTPNVAGLYHVRVRYNSATSTRMLATVYKNGSAYSRGSDVASANGIEVNVVVPMNGVTDYIEAFAYVGTGLTTEASAGVHQFQATFLRPL